MARQKQRRYVDPIAGTQRRFALLPKPVQIGRVDLVGKTVRVCFVSEDGWKDDHVIGMLRSLDDDMVQVEVVEVVTPSTVTVAAISSKTSGDTSSEILFIPWAAIRSINLV